MSHYRAVDQFTGRHHADRFWRALADADLAIRNYEQAADLIAELRCRLDEVTAERDHYIAQLATRQGGAPIPPL